MLNHTTVRHNPTEHQAPASPKNESAGVCMNPSCIHASSELLYNLSPNYKELDPCTNFEELVCGGWKENHDMRADQSTIFTGTIMSETSQSLLRHILDGSYPGSSAVSLFPSSHRYFLKHSADLTSSTLTSRQLSSQRCASRSTRKTSRK